MRFLLFLILPVFCWGLHNGEMECFSFGSKQIGSSDDFSEREIHDFESFIEESWLPHEILSYFQARGNDCFAKKNYRNALKYYQKVVSFVEQSNLPEYSALLEGICGTLFCYQCLGDDRAAEQEFNKLVSNVILIGDKIEGVDWIRESPIFCVYKNRFQNNERPIIFTSVPEMTPEEYCQFQCAGYAVAAASACLRVPNAALAALCGGCIWGLEQLCSRCCAGDGFWKNCVNPLRRLFHDPEHPENPARHPYE